MAGPKRKRTSNAAQESDAEGDRDADFVAEDGYTEEGGSTTTDAVLPPADCPFSVEYRQQKPKAKSGKKAKRHKTGLSTNTGPPPQQDLDQELPEDTTVFTVKPKKQWDSLKKYRNFVVGSENFALNEYIFVNHSNLQHGTEIEDFDEHQFWVARVLEIRAIDEAHVYLRIYWLYWPEELPGGRQPYHGQKELIASNHMEIVDAMTVSGRAHVKHWLELDEDEELPDLFWRQKFDFPTQTLMEVREHCKCHRYYNPDKLMYGCPHCKTWLHEECVQEDIKRKAYAKVVEEEGEEAIRAAIAALNVGDDAKSDNGASAAESAAAKKNSHKRKSGGSSGNGGAAGGKKGKGKGAEKEDFPTLEMLDKMFEVKITVSTEGKITRALIKDMRPRKKENGEEVVEMEEEEVEEEVEDEEDEEEEDADGEEDEEDEDGEDEDGGEGEGQRNGKKKSKKNRKERPEGPRIVTRKVLRRKPRQTWEWDVMCLLCNKGIY